MGDSWEVELGASCLFCEKNVVVKCDGNEQFVRVVDWLENRYERPLCQVVFPDMTEGQRETMISGCHEACFDEAFGGDDSEGDKTVERSAALRPLAGEEE